MTYLSAPIEDGAISILGLVLFCARSWREARDTGLAAQPHLYPELAREGGDILTPVIDSLLHIYEAVLSRPLRIGRPGDLSWDEDVLLDLLTGDKQSGDIFKDGGAMGRVFETALMSTRIMIRKAFRLPALG